MDFTFLANVGHIIRFLIVKQNGYSANILISHVLADEDISESHVTVLVVLSIPANFEAVTIIKK